METVAETMGSNKNRSILGWGQTGQGGVTRHRWVPSRHHIPPTVIHLEVGSKVALAAFARASMAGEWEGRAVQGVTRRGVGAAGIGLQRDFTARRLQWVQPADTPFP